MALRRLATVPGFLLAWLVWLGAAPLWIPLSLAVDTLGRRGGAALRSAALVTVYLSCEGAGLLASAALWTWRRVAGLDEERWLALHYRLQTWWGSTLLDAVVRLFRLRLQIDDDADLARGPYLLLVRHASTADTLLASGLVCAPHGIRLRYVVKRELLWDPCLDVVGNRLPNAFVDRSSEDTVREVGRVAALARDLGPREGLLIYPEGTRFSAAKRRRVIERFQRRGDAAMLAYAGSLECVLPPRPGGTLAALEAAPTADVVVCAHTGFEGAASLAHIWRGELLDRDVRVRLRRIGRAAIPAGSEARAAWLRETWSEVDGWIASGGTAS